MAASYHVSFATFSIFNLPLAYFKLFIGYQSQRELPTRLLQQSWTWVHFARSNPTQSSNLMTQSNPIHDNSVYSDPHPIQSTLQTIGKIVKKTEPWLHVR